MDNNEFYKLYLNDIKKYIPEQNVSIKWNGKNTKWYMERGYKYTKQNQQLIVNVFDLSIGSKYLVQYKCGYCNEIKEKAYKDILKVIVKNEKPCCKKCKFIKEAELNLEKHGVDYPFQSKQIQEKQKQSMINIYGFENPGQVPEIREKVLQTNLNKYGVYNPSQVPEFKKIATINILKTMYQNGTGMSSRPQRYLCNLLKGELCYPVSRCQLDIAFPDEMLYIEYNGGGHYAWDTLENKEKSDIKRHSYLKQFKWKLIKIVCKCDKLYNDDKMLSLIQECKEYLLNSNHTWIEINIDEDKIKCKEFVKEI